jgi:HlyD family secretion protein
MKSKIIRAIIICIVALGIGFGGYYGYKSYTTKKTVAVATQYYGVSARKMDLQVTVQGTGAAYAGTSKDISPNNNGTLQNLNVKIGDSVTAGQTLFTADSDDLRKSVTSAQTNLTKQNITLSNDKNSRTIDKSKVDADNSAIAVAKTQLEEANQALSAATSVSTTSKATIDMLTSNVTNAQSNLTKLNTTLVSDQNAIKVDDNKIVMDNLSVSDAEAQLNTANQQLEKATIIAPISGVVTAVNNTNGDSVTAGKAVITVVDMNSMKVKVSVDELDISKVKIGQKSDIKIDAVKDKNYEGTVETIAQTGTSSNNVTTYEVVIAINNSDGIKLGMNANVTISVENKASALVIPVEALIENNGQKFVRVESTDSTNSNAGDQTTSSPSSQEQKGTVKADNGQSNSTQSGNANRNNGANRAQAASGSGKLIAIKTGMETQNYIEVIEGLTEGQKVMVQLPQTSSTTTNNNRGGLSGGLSGNMGGLGGGNAAGNASGNFGNSRNQTQRSSGSNAKN